MPFLVLASVGKSFQAGTAPTPPCEDMGQWGQQSEAPAAPSALKVPACRQRKQVGQCYMAPQVPGKGDRWYCPQLSTSVAWKIHT